MTSNGGFIIPIEVKFINEIVGYGVFTKKNVNMGTLLWTPHLVTKYSPDECSTILSKMSVQEATFGFVNHMLWRMKAMYYA